MHGLRRHGLLFGLPGERAGPCHVYRQRVRDLSRLRLSAGGHTPPLVPGLRREWALPHVRRTGALPGVYWQWRVYALQR